MNSSLPRSLILDCSSLATAILFDHHPHPLAIHPAPHPSIRHARLTQICRPPPRQSEPLVAPANLVTTPARCTSLAEEGAGAAQREGADGLALGAAISDGAPPKGGTQGNLRPKVGPAELLWSQRKGCASHFKPANAAQHAPAASAQVELHDTPPCFAMRCCACRLRRPDWIGRPTGCHPALLLARGGQADQLGRRAQAAWAPARSCLARARSRPPPRRRRPARQALLPG